jgi:hypothetical protein
MSVCLSTSFAVQIIHLRTRFHLQSLYSVDHVNDESQRMCNGDVLIYF